MSESIRQLAAIMFTDIVGYTALMGKDEDRAFGLIDRNRSIQQPLIEKYNGKLLKEMGDGILASFGSTLDAVECAREIQESLRDDPELTIKVGIHLGDVTFKDDDAYGDGVNIASRIVEQAGSGDIFISESVYKTIKNKAGFKVDFVGEESLKNVEELVKIYRVSDESALFSGAPGVPSSSTQPASRIRTIIVAVVGVGMILLLAYFFFGRSEEATRDEPLDKSIAVLPFADMSQSQDQEYLGDGIAEEILNVLSKIEGLKVIGRTSSFSYRGKNTDLRTIGKELGVGTILEGSVRKSGNQIRVTAQLINTNDGSHIWSETYERDLVNIFDIQDEIASSISGRLEMSLLRGADPFRSRRVQNVQAYETYLLARQKLALRGAKNLIEARRLFQQAIGLDPLYSPAYSGLGRVLSLLPYSAYSITPREAAVKGNEMVNKALELDNKNAEAHAVKGTLAGYYTWDWEMAELSLLKAYELAPQNAEIINFLGDFYRQIRHPRSCEMEELAVTMDPLRAINYSDLAGCYGEMMGDFERSKELGLKAYEMGPISFTGTPRGLLDSYLKLGNMKAAKNLYNEILPQGDNDESIRNLLLYFRIRIAFEEGNYEEAISDLQELEELAREKRYSPFRVGSLYLDAGLIDKALEMMTLAYERKDFFLVINVLDKFREHPEFDEIFSKPELNTLFEIRRKNLGLKE